MDTSSRRGRHLRTLLCSLAVAVALVTSMPLSPARADQRGAPPAGFTPGAPVPHTHAHNDYEHEHPLWDALAHGFTSVEADVFWGDGNLPVGHDEQEASHGRKLDDLYLRPIAELVRQNHGSVYPGWKGQLQLLIDIKDRGPQTYAAVESALAKYPTVFSHVDHGTLVPGPVQAVISGDRPLERMLSQTPRYGFYDGRPGDLTSDSLDAEFMPLVSENYGSLFTWSGKGAMPEAEHSKLVELVTAAHRRGHKVRFWATPDEPDKQRDAVWSTLLEAGVDYLNTDDLPGLEAFIHQHEGAPVGPTTTPTPTTPAPTSTVPSTTPSASSQPSSGRTQPRPLPRTGC